MNNPLDRLPIVLHYAGAARIIGDIETTFEEDRRFEPKQKRARMRLSNIHDYCVKRVFDTIDERRALLESLTPDEFAELKAAFDSAKANGQITSEGNVRR